ncbi:MAG: hypothetical protein HDQ88_11975 [Clostridia bacterium]|nr:hypothetical protein [Clostridia bacterium]
MIYLLEDKHFSIFKLNAREMINKLGLSDWHITFDIQELSDGDLAQCHINRVAKKARLVLNSVFYDVEPTDEKLMESAYHEVLELLLDDIEAPCWIESLSVEDRQKALNSGRHTVINRLLRVL